MTGFRGGLRDLAASTSSAVGTAVNETLIRLAVTGLSRAGKTVFITSLIRNLLALGQGRGTLTAPAGVSGDGGREFAFKHVRILPAGAAAIPAFDYPKKFAELASESPSWPPRTDDLAHIVLDIEVERSGTFWRKLGPRRISLEILDYPGEWLLDLPLLSRSYAIWSEETLALIRRPPRDAVFEEFLAFLNTFDPHSPVDDDLIRRGRALYCTALSECRERFGLRYLQPGRFLCPGPRSDAPFMWFFPISHAETQTAGSAAGTLLRDRYEAYKADMRATFFDTYFEDFDRQVVLVDVLGALHAGKEAFEDTARAIADISAGMNYGWNVARPVQEFGAAALRVTAQLLNPRLYWATGDKMSRALKTCRVERVAFVATKADHVPAMRRDNLRNLLRALAETARDELRRTAVTYHSVASVLSTEDGSVTMDGRPVEVVFGVPLEEECARPFYPGEVPSAFPRESFWSDRYFELPVFKPPRIDPTGAAGIPHLGLDEGTERYSERCAVISRGPGFIDAPQSERSEPSVSTPDMMELPSDPVGPILLDAVSGEVRGRIDPLWEPEVVVTRRSGPSPLSWLAGGLALLLLSWLLLSLAAFVLDQFRRSSGLGVLTLICFGIALGLVTCGLWGELRAFRALRRVDDLRLRFSLADISVRELQAIVLPWLHTIRRHLEEPERVVTVVEAATSTSAIKAALRREVVGPLRQAARQAGRRAALEGGAVVAITPAPALEGVIVGLRALLLIRQVAGIYGIRPGFLVMLALLRRVAWTAAGVSGFALLSQTLATHALHKLPILKDLAGALPETSLAAVRLYRLASITAEACSPVARGGNE